jgi:hypothetical protein
VVLKMSMKARTVDAHGVGMFFPTLMERQYATLEGVTVDGSPVVIKHVECVSVPSDPRECERCRMDSSCVDLDTDGNICAPYVNERWFAADKVIGQYGTATHEVVATNGFSRSLTREAPHA